MTRMILLLLAAPALFLTPVVARSEESIVPSVSVGGPHGKPFDDIAIVRNQHRRLRQIIMSPCEPGVELTYLRFEYAVSTNQNHPTTDFSEHGTLHKDRKRRTLELADGEYIVDFTGFPMKVPIGILASYKTRLGALGFLTSHGQSVACGVQELGKEPENVSAGDHHAFLYFSGGAGDVIDHLTGQIIPVKDYF